MASSRRRLASPFATILALSLAGGACWFGAESAARYLEDRSRQDVEQALSDQDWVRVTTDGLQVRLTGTAPSELDRFRAMTLAGGAVDPARVVDGMTVASAEATVMPSTTRAGSTAPPARVMARKRSSSEGAVPVRRTCRPSVVTRTQSWSDKACSTSWRDRSSR